MGLQIVLGVSKTGKSTYIYDNIKKDISENENVFLFVPSFMKVKAEEEYMKFLSTNGLIGVNITTIQDFIENKLKKYNFNLDKKYLSNIDKKLILSSIIKNEKDTFKMFSKVVNKPGFINSLSIYMDLIRKSNINIEEELPSLKNKLLESKLSELISIYKKYESKMSEKYVDYEDEMNIFLDNILKLELSNRNVKIYFDGYNNFNKSEYLFIEKLLKNKFELTISLCTDIIDVNDVYSGETLDIFSTANKTYLKLLKLANSSNVEVRNMVLDNCYFNGNKDVKFLSDNLFKLKSDKYKSKSENIHLELLTSPYDEAKYIAKKINQKIKEGYRYNDFLIYTTNIDEYEDIIKREFYEYKIPFYSNVNYNMLDSVLVQYIIRLLDIVESGLKSENIISILKLGLNDFEIEDVSILENYIKEFNIYSFNKEFQRNNNGNSEYLYDLEKINKLREKVITIFDKFTNIDKNDIEILTIGKCIYEHLNTENVFENYDKNINELKENLNYEVQKKIAVSDQIWDNLVTIFNSMYKVYEKESLDIRNLKEIVLMLINTVNLKTIPETMDQVELADINGYSASPKKQVFFVGVNENKFPNISNQDILLKDSELEILEKKDMFLKETVTDKQKMVEFNIYQAINNVSEKLYVLIPSIDANLNTLRKSAMVSSIEKIMNLKVEGSVTKEDDKLDIYSTSKDEIFEKVIDIIINNKLSDYDLKTIKEIYKFFKNDEKYGKILAYVKSDDNLNKKSIENIFGEELETSVSKLELFKKCPFSYFMNYSLGLKEQKEFQISVMDIGSFMHEVLEEFSCYLTQNEIPWHSLLIEEEFQKVSNKLEEIINSKFNKILIKNEENVRFFILKNRLYNTMKKVVMVIATSFNQSEFLPAGYEISFSNNSVLAPIRIKIGENSFMNIIGKIDRVDKYVNEDTEYVRIVDYKSSARDLNLDDIKEGISLQLVTYLDAYIKNTQKNNKDKKIIPAGMLYFNLSNNLVNIKEFTTDEEEIKNEVVKKLKLKGIFLSDVQILEKMDKNFKSKNSFIDITARSLENKNKALKEDEYESLLKETEEILKNIGKEIMAGKVKIKPNKKADYCKYCKFSDVCRKDICL